MPYTEKQRRFACAQMGKSRKNFKGKKALTKKEAEEMCKGPLKKEDISEELLDEIKDYFRNQSDKDYLEFDDHPLSDIESLMDPDKPAPWDHLTNDEDDGDVDIDLKRSQN
tara:strand:- start:3031 stop:3363 length:333 start_codon:yes stop_codon:yes gene_type:complete